jgi:hypothetical protein
MSPLRDDSTEIIFISSGTLLLTAEMADYVSLAFNKNSRVKYSEAIAFSWGRYMATGISKPAKYLHISGPTSRQSSLPSPHPNAGIDID